MNDTERKPGLARPVASLIDGAIDLAERIPAFFYELAMRIGIAMVFWQSARTKVDGLLSVKPSTFFLFQYEYDLPLISHDVAAYLATYAEHFFPLLIVLGFCTRLGAAALLVMTLVIQIFVYPGAWATHLLWASVLLYLVARGPGVISIDHLLGRRFPRAG